MLGALLRPGETLGGTSAIGPLPPDRNIAFTIGGIGNALTIRGPDRESIVALHGQLANGMVTREVVDSDLTRAAVIDLNGQLFSVWRQARKVVAGVGHFQNICATPAIRHTEREVRG